MPLSVSVIIPTYNRVRFVVEAIQSVLRQTVPVLEIIVVDDGSTDDTEVAVRCLPAPVRYLRQENQGPAAARNRGMREAQGEWLAFHDSDDLWIPEKLALQAEFLSRHPQLDFLFGHLSNFSDAGGGEAPEILDQAVNAYLQTNASDLRDLFRQLLISNPIPTPTVLIRRSVLGKVGFFDESLRCCEDYHYWLSIAHHCRCGFIDRVLVQRRMHGGNLVNDYVHRFERLLEVLDQIPNRFPDLQKETRRSLLKAQARTRYRLGSWYLKRHDSCRARTLLGQVALRELWPDYRSCFLLPIKRTVAILA